MKFLTRRSVGPLASDRSASSARERYRMHLTEVAREMTDSVSLLSKTDFSDGRIVFAKVFDASVLVRFLVGNLQVGYSNLEAHYFGRVDLALWKQSKALLYERMTEILESEVIRDGLWIHNLLLYPKGELSIPFEKTTLKSERLPGRIIDYFGEPLVFAPTTSAPNTRASSNH